MKNEFVIPKWAWVTATVVLLLGLGIFISPRDRDNRPLLLLPDVKALGDYRRELVDWHLAFQSLNARMTGLLSADYGGDLFSQSREGQKIQDETLQLLREIDQTVAPMAATPAKEMALKAGNAYLEASRALLAWISTPTTVNSDAVQQALDTAQAALAELEASQWMTANP
jgi:hypothetical protein